jgi:hypothetical protein
MGKSPADTHEFLISRHRGLLQSERWSRSIRLRFEPNTGFPKGDRMFSRSISKMLLFFTILLAAVASAIAAAPPNEEAQSSVGSIHTYLMPDLSLKSVFSVPVLAQPEGAGFRKTCRCSCGTAPCATDADCGGGVGSCSPFISCCAKGDGALSFSGADKSSRKTKLPAFKGSCN